MISHHLVVQNFQLVSVEIVLSSQTRSSISLGSAGSLRFPYYNGYTTMSFEDGGRVSFLLQVKTAGWDELLTCVCACPMCTAARPKLAHCLGSE